MTPPGYPPAAPRATNTMAIVALVLALVFAPAGVVCGHIARRQIRSSGEEGAGLATAALVVGYILTGLYVVLCCGAVILTTIAARNS
jgi:uncharacterized protein DUF4190